MQMYTKVQIVAYRTLYFLWLWGGRFCDKNLQC